MGVMNMPNIVFHREGLKAKTLELSDENVRMQNRREGAQIINFNAPEEKAMEIHQFFDDLDELEPVSMDIDNTGAVEHYFRGISPVKDGEDEGLPIKTFSVTLQLRREFI
jgi:hypothetical protein